MINNAQCLYSKMFEPKKQSYFLAWASILKWMKYIRYNAMLISWPESDV